MVCPCVRCSGGYRDAEINPWAPEADMWRQTRTHSFARQAKRVGEKGAMEIGERRITFQLGVIRKVF